MKNRFALLCTALLATPGTALAHPGHVAEGLHGHDHYLALAILGGLALALLIAGVYWLWRKSGPAHLPKPSK